MKRYLWENNEVYDCKDVREFLTKYYKPERYTGRGEEYAQTLLTSREKDVAENGYTIISQHDSVTGRVVAFRDRRLSC